MTEVEIIREISVKQNEFLKKQSEKADADVLAAIEKEIAELMASLRNVDQEPRSPLDECAGYVSF